MLPRAEMKDDDRDTQRMDLRPEDVEAPAVQKFNFRTDPGGLEGEDAELLKGVSRARASREQREELSEALDRDRAAAVPVEGPPAAQKVTIVHQDRWPTWIVFAVFALPLAILALGIALVLKARAPHVSPPAPTLTLTATPTLTATHALTATVTPTPTATLTATAPVAATTTAAATASARPRPSASASATARRPHTPVAAPPAATSAAAPAPTSDATSHHDGDIVRVPGL